MLLKKTVLLFYCSICLPNPLNLPFFNEFKVLLVLDMTLHFNLNLDQATGSRGQYAGLSNSHRFIVFQFVLSRPNSFSRLYH